MRTRRGWQPPLAPSSRRCRYVIPTLTPRSTLHPASGVAIARTFCEEIEDRLPMTLAITILATITAVVMLITKLIELQVAQAKLNELAATNAKSDKAPITSNKDRQRARFSRGFFLPIVFMVVIIWVFATGWIATIFGLGIVVFCSIAIPFFAIMPFLHRIIDTIEGSVELIGKQTKLSGLLVNLHTHSQNKDTEQDAALKQQE